MDVPRLPPSELDGGTLAAVPAAFGRDQALWPITLRSELQLEIGGSEPHIPSIFLSAIQLQHTFLNFFIGTLLSVSLDTINSS